MRARLDLALRLLCLYGSNVAVSGSTIERPTCPHDYRACNATAGAWFSLDFNHLNMYHRCVSLFIIVWYVLVVSTVVSSSLLMLPLLFPPASFFKRTVQLRHDWRGSCSRGHSRRASWSPPESWPTTRSCARPGSSTAAAWTTSSRPSPPQLRPPSWQTRGRRCKRRPNKPRGVPTRASAMQASHSSIS